MNKKFVSRLLILVLICSGCTSSVDDYPTPSKTELSFQTHKTQAQQTEPSLTTIIVHPTLTPTKKLSPLMSSPTPASTIQPTISNYTQCTGLGLLQEPSPSFEFPGILAYYDNDQKKIVFIGGNNKISGHLQNLQRSLNLLDFHLMESGLHIPLFQQ